MTYIEAIRNVLLTTELGICLSQIETNAKQQLLLKEFSKDFDILCYK